MPRRGNKQMRHGGVQQAKGMRRKAPLKRDGAGARAFASQRSEIKRSAPPARKPSPAKKGKRRSPSARRPKPPQWVRDAVAERSQGLCEAGWACFVPGEGYQRATQMHHRWRRGQGGPDTVANLLHVCTPCHTRIHADPHALFRRWLLPTGSDPETHPPDPRGAVWEK